MRNLGSASSARQLACYIFQTDEVHLTKAQLISTQRALQRLKNMAGDAQCPGEVVGVLLAAGMRHGLFHEPRSRLRKSHQDFGLPGVAGSVTLQQPVGLDLAQVVTELVEPVGAVGEVEGGEDGVVDLLGSPAADLTTAVQQDLEEADDTRVVDLDSGIADGADGDWKAEALQQRKVDVDVELLRLDGKVPAKW
jgi:hypothetical protein